MAYGTYILSKALDCYNEYVANLKYKPYTSADGWKFAKKSKKSR